MAIRAVLNDGFGGASAHFSLPRCRTVSDNPIRERGGPRGTSVFRYKLECKTERFRERVKTKQGNASRRYTARRRKYDLKFTRLLVGSDFLYVPPQRTKEHGVVTARRLWWKSEQKRFCRISRIVTSPAWPGERWSAVVPHPHVDRIVVYNRYGPDSPNTVRTYSEKWQSILYGDAY